METKSSDLRDMTPEEEAAEVEHLLGTATLNEIAARLGRPPGGLIKALERAGRPDLALRIKPLPLDPIAQARRFEDIEAARQAVTTRPAPMETTGLRGRSYRGAHLAALVEPLIAQGMKRQEIADELGMGGAHNGSLVTALKRAGRQDLVDAIAVTAEERRAAMRKKWAERKSVAA